MGTLPTIIGDWGHVLAAVLFAALAVRASRKQEGGPEHLILIIALAMTASWATYIAVAGISAPLSGVFESLRNGGWMLFMFILLHKGESQVASHPAAITAIYGVLCGLLIAQAGVDALYAKLQVEPDLIAAVRDTAMILRMIVAVGALFLVHHLFTICAPEAQARIGLLMAALVAMWTYDLNYYTISYLAGSKAIELLAARGMAVAMLAPIIALGIRAGGSRRVQFSHTVAFRSLSIVAVALYLVAVAAVIAMVDWIAGPYARVAEIAAMFTLAAGALILVPSPRFKSWLKVQVAKHFFQHRYDYRVEWMRFTETVGQPTEGADGLEQRVVKAMADITDSPAGILLLRDGAGLSMQTAWNWRGETPPVPALDAEHVEAIKQHGWIVDIDHARDRREPITATGWLIADLDAWALVPLLHFDDLVGAIVLARPRISRRLDWEDLDMLRAAGRQVASYISEAQGQSALNDAQRFEEFNRRFAFIMHDIKNLVSQLSLLARNAERHADKPEFRADMIATLQESVGKMNDMLARLSQHHKGRQEDAEATALRPIAERIARDKRSVHAVDVTGEAPLALVGPQRIEQILQHLVQNAIDASPDEAPILVRLGTTRGMACIDVVDKGVGMTAEFVRRDLFKPFASSKESGFGIGAFEARELTRGMGGEIEVRSRPGEGSCFTLLFPVAPTNAMTAERAA